MRPSSHRDRRRRTFCGDLMLCAASAMRWMRLGMFPLARVTSNQAFSGGRSIEKAPDNRPARRIRLRGPRPRQIPAPLY